MKQRKNQPIKNTQACSIHFAQRGSALITGLVFLVVLTLLGLSASSGSIQRELIARNIRDQNLALQAAEAALQTAETWVRLDRGSGLPDGVTIFADTTCVTACETGSSSWWVAANSTVLGSGANHPPSFPDVSAPPAFLIEYLTPTSQQRSSMAFGGVTNTPFYYRITARGTGLSLNTVRMVRSIYRR